MIFGGEIPLELAFTEICGPNRFPVSFQIRHVGTNPNTTCWDQSICFPPKPYAPGSGPELTLTACGAEVSYTGVWRTVKKLGMR